MHFLIHSRLEAHSDDAVHCPLGSSSPAVKHCTRTPFAWRMETTTCLYTNLTVSHVDFSICSIEIDMSALVASALAIPIEAVPDIIDELNHCLQEEDSIFAEVEEFNTAFQQELADGGLEGALLRLLPEPAAPVTVPSICEKTKRPMNHSKKQKAILMEWLATHKDRPYPTDDEKEALCMETEMSFHQVQRWFQNARTRLLRKSPGQETKKGRPRKRQKVS